MTIENAALGYTSSQYLSGLTEVLYEIQNPSTGKTITTFNSTGRSIVSGHGYTNVLRTVYALTVSFPASAPFFLLWNSVNPTDSLISPLNSEYTSLTGAGWVVAASFYMFSDQGPNGRCYLFQSIYVGNITFEVNSKVSFIF